MEASVGRGGFDGGIVFWAPVGGLEREMGVLA